MPPWKKTSRLGQASEILSTPRFFITSLITVRNHEGTPEMLVTLAEAEASTSAGSFSSQSGMRAIRFEGMRKSPAKGLMRSIRVALRSPILTRGFSGFSSLANEPPRIKPFPANMCDSGLRRR